jgi:hypothetical protein
VEVSVQPDKLVTETQTLSILIFLRLVYIYD